MASLRQHLSAPRPLASRPSPLVLSILVGICLLGFGLRVYQIDAFSFWQDEALTPLRAGYGVGQILSNEVVVQGVVTNDTHPPLYFLIIHFLTPLLGESDFAFRLPSALAGVLLLPLLYHLGRRLSGPAVGLTAALLGAINPLQIWYAHEARMYTVAVLLMAAATDALWRGLTTPRVGRWLVLYVACAAAALYTHYTAIFLIALQGLFWAWRLWQRGQKKLILAAAAVGLLASIPLAPVTLPRLFTGAETNYFFVPLRIILFDVVHAYGLGLTTEISRPEIVAVDVLTAALLIAGVWGVHRQRRRKLSAAFLLAYLLAIALGLYAGSYLKPMYQGVRHIMLGSPAFLLLAARGAFALPRPRLTAPLALLILITGPVLSLNNLYTDPTYAKDDFRSLIRHVEMRAAPGDLVLYNDAINMLLHDHYGTRDDVAVTAIPRYPRPFDDEERRHLAETVTGRSRVWFITDPPAGDRDRERRAEAWLEEQWRLVARHSEHARVSMVETALFAPRAENGSALESVNLRWANMPDAVGWQPAMPLPIAAPTFWFHVDWRGDELPGPKAGLRIGLWDQHDHQWVDNNQPFWRTTPEPDEDGVTRLLYGVDLPAGLPPGTYELRLHPISPDGTAGEWATLGTVPVAPSQQWAILAPPDYDNIFPIRFADGTVLRGVANSDLGVRPGHTLPLLTYWNAPVPPIGATYELTLVGDGGQPLKTVSGPLAPAWMETGQWRAKTLLNALVGLYIPPDTPPGTYELQWRLRRGEETVAGRPVWRPWESDSVTVGDIEVEPWPLVTEIPPLATGIDARFGTDIALRGYDLPQRAVRLGDPLELTLIWQAVAPPAANYFVFVHLVDPGSGEIVSQIDRIPVEWLRPTGGWRQDEVLVDAYALPIPPELAPGTYLLNVGFFDPDSFVRPPVTRAGQPLPDGQLPLAEIEVRP